MVKKRVTAKRAVKQPIHFVQMWLSVDMQHNFTCQTLNSPLVLP